MATAMIAIMLLICGGFLAVLATRVFMRPVILRREKRRYEQWKKGQRPSYL